MQLTLCRLLVLVVRHVSVDHDLIHSCQRQMLTKQLRPSDELSGIVHGKHGIRRVGGQEQEDVLNVHVVLEDLHFDVVPVFVGLFDLH